MVGWARKYGIQSTIHTGGPSIPGSGLIDSAVVLEADTDVVGHINGGHTALPDREIRCICEGCRRGLEIVHNGNERAALYTLRTARAMNQMERLILGTDGPAGSGVQPLGILRMISMLSSLGEVPAEIAFCLGGAVVTETIFSWPGVGRLAVGAILSADFPMAQGTILVLAGGFILVNLGVDLLYVVLDPRVRG